MLCQPKPLRNDFYIPRISNRIIKTLAPNPTSNSPPRRNKSPKPHCVSNRDMSAHATIPNWQNRPLPDTWARLGPALKIASSPPTKRPWPRAAKGHPRTFRVHPAAAVVSDRVGASKHSGVGAPYPSTLAASMINRWSISGPTMAAVSRPGRKIAAAMRRTCSGLTACNLRWT